jgi:hypothetical protein
MSRCSTCKADWGVLSATLRTSPAAKLRQGYRRRWGSMSRCQLWMGAQAQAWIASGYEYFHGWLGWLLGPH